jgi:hypothetical protein
MDLYRFKFPLNKRKGSVLFLAALKTVPADICYEPAGNPKIR